MSPELKTICSATTSTGHVVGNFLQKARNVNFTNIGERVLKDVRRSAFVVVEKKKLEPQS